MFFTEFLLRVSWSSSALLIVSLTSIFLSSASRAQSVSSAERQLFDAANRERKGRGIPALRWDEALASAARNHASEMAKRGTVSHQFPGESNLPTRARQASARYSSLAEDVDQGPNMETIHRSLMASPLHRANILDSSMDSAGIGVAERDGQWFAVEDFSKAR
ncbi:exported hypothetical protein [Candidatus Sulfotelmatobacter sp. SbA7]|nr:exported hypothetical protein [Candidatus Sulfotelmatobacter sp. SbA7]